MKKTFFQNIKRIIKAGAAIFGLVFVGLNIFAKIKKNRMKKDEDLQKDLYEGAGSPVLNTKKTMYEKYLKRGIDVFMSSLGLILLSPVFLFLAVAIYIDDPGPIFFTQKRVGLNKTYFKLFKFRSMRMDTPHDTPTHMLADPEQYITRIGKILRKYSLDELPQFFNILVGDLSIVGPRPALWNQADLVEERDKYAANDVMPGLTGWAQINGRDELEISVKAKFDGEYVEKLRKNTLSGMLMDAKCFFGTITSVLKSDGVVEGGTGELHKAENSRYDIEDVQTQIGFGEAVEVDFNQHKKILITGANSYIGESFEQYAKEHYNKNFDIDTVDMIDGSWREKDFSAYDTVFHVAGIAHADVGNVSDEVKAKYYAVNTNLAIETAGKAKADGVKQFVFMSSMIVYGESAPYGKEKVITAETKPEPANFYGDSKWQADKGVRALADDTFNVLVLRPPMIYGKGSKGNYPTLAKLAKKMPVFPDVKNQRSMLHIDNLSEFLCQVMLVGKGGVFFPQNSKYTKTSEMVKEISKVAKKKILLTKILNPGVLIASKIPGKVSGLVNKAFGNMTYDKALSLYNGLEYECYSLRESIMKTESKDIRKKKVAIVSNVYFWLPDEPGPSRFYYIAKVFAENGYEVEVITSDFQHFEKKHRDLKKINSQAYPFKLTILNTVGYKKNIDPRRILSHGIFAQKTCEYLSTHINEYAAIYCSLPSNNVAARVSKLCKKHDIAFVVDIEDLWPEAMSMIVKNEFIGNIIFYPLLRDAEKAYKNADAVVGTSNDYTNRAFKRQENRVPSKTVYVGCDIKIFDEGVDRYSNEIEKSNNEIWVTYAGSIGTSYDIKTLIDAGAKFAAEDKVKINILGTGPLKEELEEYVRNNAIKNVEFWGYVEYPKMAAVLSKSDITINSFVKGAPQSIVNKIGDYLASGKPMINTLENPEFCNLVDDSNIGINVEPENPEVLYKAIRTLIEDKGKYDMMAKKSRELAESEFDRDYSYKKIVELVDKAIKSK